ncbi:MAG: 16S rRNA (cytosine(1402)-N(4))-methyltransferase RsmH [Rhodocyclaceae bacterium]|nr:16S rRNA (cytosine(1402)-N(4))-methyltransferase RsmH [Rhodocyclaceae bacterium]
MTVGGTHVTVLLEEAVESLAIKENGVYLDGTFGRGGHSRLILSRLNENGRLIAVDRDLQAIAAGAAITDPRFNLVHRAFGDLAEAANEAGVMGVDGVLLDVGVSSPQIDDGERGFSFRHDAPLDMRMDTTQGETAAEWLARAEIRDITEVIRNYGEERFAFQIAKKVVAARLEQPIVTTGQFAAIVRATVRTREPGQDPATRSFQALRIHINQELRQLEIALPQALELLRPGGRLVVISFHSLEDRIVKNFMRNQSVADDMPKGLPLRADQLPKPKLRLVGKQIKASAAEVAANPRARSAVMRVAEKL